MFENFVLHSLTLLQRQKCPWFVFKGRLRFCFIVAVIIIISFFLIFRT